MRRDLEDHGDVGTGEPRCLQAPGEPAGSGCRVPLCLVGALRLRADGGDLGSFAVTIEVCAPQGQPHFVWGPRRDSTTHPAERSAIALTTTYPSVLE
ncbi:MAG: hypothetical protein QOG20_1666 [Pseudonocardiales bacterium]|nr:hypothetical protein [Pseudonocardiales bacterium]